MEKEHKVLYNVQVMFCKGNIRAMCINLFMSNNYDWIILLGFAWEQFCLTGLRKTITFFQADVCGICILSAANGRVQ